MLLCCLVSAMLATNVPTSRGPSSKTGPRASKDSCTAPVWLHDFMALPQKVAKAKFRFLSESEKILVATYARTPEGRTTVWPIAVAAEGAAGVPGLVTLVRRCRNREVTWTAFEIVSHMKEKYGVMPSQFVELKAALKESADALAIERERELFSSEWKALFDAPSRP